MTAPLEGIRVVEVANWLAAPSAAALMADLGADVIKVEPPGGDAYRQFNLGIGYDGEGPPVNHAFELDNRGKRSITVDVSQSAGAEVVHRLAASADIFITNLLQPRRERYGLAIDDIRAANDRIIYVSFSGYGTEGPDAGRAGFDYAAFWARSGVMNLLGDPDAPPILCRPGQGDHTTALNLLAATLAALRLRDMTGEGQVVDVTLVGTGLWTVGTDMSGALVSRQQPPRHNRASPPNPLWNAYRCGDGRYILLVMVQPDPYWPGFCAALGHPEWQADARYDSLQHRAEHSAELTSGIADVFAGRRFEEWGAILDAHGMIWAPVAELPEVAADPTIRSLGTFTEVTRDGGPSFETLSAPFHIRGADVAVRGPAPDPGEHTNAVLEQYGFTSEEVALLAASGVLG
jgi:crotonobetainyl-CoA:carnitine CoA-transferase CaiB-like acyl-CoA transferase